MGWYKIEQNLTPKQIELYQNFKTPSGIQLTGNGMSAVFSLPGINQTLNVSQLMNKVVDRIKPILIQNGVHTIDTSSVSRADAIGVAVSSEPGTVHVDIAKIFNQIKNQALPSITQLDGTVIDNDAQSDIIGKISSFITNQLANTSAHESFHNQDYLNSFPKGEFESSESGAKGFGDQVANNNFKISNLNFGWYKKAQLSNFLQQSGYSLEFINYVNSLPKHVQKHIGGVINQQGIIPEQQLSTMIQKFLTLPPPISKPKNEIRTPILDARFQSPQEKQQFFNNIAKEYIPWVSGQLNDQRFDFIPSEDGLRLFTILNSLTDLKKRTGILLEKDINKYKDFLELEHAVELFSGTGSKSKGFLQYNPLSLAGVNLVKRMNADSDLLKISNADSLAKLGIGTKWCTREDYGSGNMSESYIKRYGHIFMIVKDGKPFIQMTPDLSQIMNVNDVSIPLPRSLYDMFGDEYAKKIRISPKVLQLFNNDEASNNSELLLKTIKDFPNTVKLASPELMLNPTFALKAINAGANMDEFKDLMESSEEFTNACERIIGQYDYDLSHSEMDDELEKTIYGTNNFGVEINLNNWSYEEAYDAVSEVLLDRSGSRYNNDGGFQTYRCSKILARAAYDSDISRIKAKEFDEIFIRTKAFLLAAGEKKYRVMKFDKTRPESYKQLIEPYMVKAEQEVKKDLIYYNKQISPMDLASKIEFIAFEMMQQERRHPSFSRLEDLSLENQQLYISKAIDSNSQIAKIYDTSEINNEKLELELDGADYEREPDINNFDNEESYQEAMDEWQEEKDEQDQVAQTEARKNNLPWCLDDAIIEDFFEIYAKNKIELPAWIVKTFSEKSNNIPTLVRAIRNAEILKNEKMQAKQKNESKRSSGWYNNCKFAEEFLAKKIKDIYAITFDEAIRSDIIEDGNKFKSNGAYTFVDDSKMICRDDDFNMWVEDKNDFEKRYKIKNGKPKQIRSPFKEGFWQRYEPTESATNIIEEVSDDEVLLKDDKENGDEWKITKEEYEKNYKKISSKNWYKNIKTSEEEILLNEWREERELRKEANIIIDSDLNGIEPKEDGDLIRIEAYDDQRNIVIGHLNYYTQGNTLQIEMIEVGEAYKRQGIATQLIQKMKQDHPGLRIEPGLVSHQGQPFFKKLKQRKII